MEFPPNFGNPLPVADVNAPNPPKIGLTLTSKGKRNLNFRETCPPRISTIGKPRQDVYVQTPFNRIEKFQKQREMQPLDDK